MTYTQVYDDYEQVSTVDMYDDLVRRAAAWRDFDSITAEIIADWLHEWDPTTNDACNVLAEMTRVHA